MNSNTLRHWPTLLEISLALVLTVQAGRLVWMFFTPTVQTEQVKGPSLPSQVPALVTYDPFFENQAATSADLSGWRLFGVRTTAEDASAILAKDKDPQGAFQVGDEIAHGIVLEAVAADHVMVREGGASRRLDLAAPNIANAAPPALPPSQLPNASPPLSNPAKEASSVDPVQLLTRTGLQTKSEDGRVTGYALMPGGNDALLRQAGLRPGDVLLSVNGQALDPEHLPEVIGQLKNDPRAVVKFTRDGQTHTVTLGSGTQ